MTAIRERVARFWAWLDLDARDGFFFTGLALLGGGLWWMYPPVAPAVCGLILVLYAMGVGQ